MHRSNDSQLTASTDTKDPPSATALDMGMHQEHESMGIDMGSKDANLSNAGRPAASAQGLVNGESAEQHRRALFQILVCPTSAAGLFLKQTEPLPS